MQVIEFSECLRSVINMSMTAKEYYDCLYTDKHLHEMSLIYIQNKKYDVCMTKGLKEKCINLIKESWNNADNSEAFYQYLLVNISCNEVMIESLYTILADMLSFCRNTGKKENMCYL